MPKYPSRDQAQQHRLALPNLVTPFGAQARRSAAYVRSFKAITAKRVVPQLHRVMGQSRMVEASHQLVAGSEYGNTYAQRWSVFTILRHILRGVRSFALMAAIVVFSAVPLVRSLWKRSSRHSSM